jgi:hypothetical protein
MAIMAPEVIGGLGAGDAAGAGVAGGLLGRKGSAGGDGGEGSPAAFMLSIFLLGIAMILLWVAFHTPADWDAESGNFPGLLNRILGWMTATATQPGIFGGLDNPFGGSSSGVTEKPIPDTGLGAKTGQVAAGALGPIVPGSTSPTYPTPTGAPPPDQWLTYYSSGGWRGSPGQSQPTASGSTRPAGVESRY